MKPPDPVATTIEVLLDDEPSIAAAVRAIEELLAALEIPVAPTVARSAGLASHSPRRAVRASASATDSAPCTASSVA